MTVIVSWSVIVIVSLPGAIENNFIWGYSDCSIIVIIFWSVIVIVSLPGAIENNFIWGLSWMVYERDSFLVCDCGSFVA